MEPDPAISVALFDVDGVVRHYDPDHVTAVEARWSLPPGALLAAAFDPALLRALTTGRLRRRDWVTEIGRRVGVAAAAVEWASHPGRIDDAVLDLIDEVRATGCTVALFSNGSDELAAELAAHGVDRHVDLVLNSAELAVAKPAPEAFRAACERLGVDDPARALFVDDTRANVEGAARVGLHTHLYDGPAGLRALLEQLHLLSRTCQPS